MSLELVRRTADIIAYTPVNYDAKLSEMDRVTTVMTTQLERLVIRIETNS